MRIGHKFVDLDEQIQEKFRIKHGTHKPCRKIVFRAWRGFSVIWSVRHSRVVNYQTPCVIALGGGLA